MRELLSGQQVYPGSNWIVSVVLVSGEQVVSAGQYLHALELLGFLFAAWQVSLITALRVLLWSFALNFDRQLCSGPARWSLNTSQIQTVSRWPLIHAGMWAQSLSLHICSMFYAGCRFIQSLFWERHTWYYHITWRLSDMIISPWQIKSDSQEEVTESERLQGHVWV